MAELVFFNGTMDCGKSTLALQMHHNHAARGRAGVIFTKLDRAGTEVLSSRLGLSTPAREVTDDLDLWDEVVETATAGGRVDYLICDEAQFYTPAQVEQLARLVDEMGLDVFAFGITADFRATLFPARSGSSSSPTACSSSRWRRCAGAGAGPPTTPGCSTGSWSSRASRWSSGTWHRPRPGWSSTRCSAGATTCAG